MLSPHKLINIPTLCCRLLLAASLLIANQANALTVQARGQAVIVSGDLSTARNIAIKRAKQKAALQSSAYISTQQQMEQGVIIQDTLSSESLAQVGKAQVLDESISGNILSVLISVNIATYNKCSNGSTANNYRKRIALAGFPMIDPSQSKIGKLRNIESSLATELAKRLTGTNGIEALNAGQLMLQPDPSTAATTQLAQGSLTTVLQQTQQLDVQYVVSGVVRDLSMLTPSVFRQKNYFIDAYHKQDYLSSRYMRAFEVDLYIHDGFTGALISQKSYRTAGRWSTSDRQKFGFASSPFWQLDYGKQVSNELDTMARDITNTLRCNNFSVEISRTSGSKIWFKAGRASGIKPGDRFDVYRKSTFYDYQQNPTIELNQTPLTLTVSKVQANSAEGRADGVAGQNNIQTGDVLVSQ